MPEKETRRGYVSKDEKEFDNEELIRLCKAQQELAWLLNRGYPIKSAIVFVGNHYLFSERQRLALVRATSSENDLRIRKSKEIQLNELNRIKGQTIQMDGLNEIITLEVALSNSTLLKCMDGTIRDLAGLRGTYRLIDKTIPAIQMIGEALEKMQIGKASIYLDSPVSNTGRLKSEILAQLSKFSYEVEVTLVPNADIILQTKEHVITSDAIILNHCISWINLTAYLLQEKRLAAECIALSNSSCQ